MKQNSIKDIVKNNEERVKQFINESLTTKNGPTTEKILTNCPKCGGPFKVTINLDWSNCYCHKCSTSWTLYNFFKEIGSASSFIELLEEFSKVSISTENFFNHNIRTETEEELVKIYLYDYYSMIQKILNNYNIISRFRRENEILRPQLYSSDADKIYFSDLAVLNFFEIGGSIVSENYSSPEFDNTLGKEIDVNPIYKKVYKLRDELLKVSPENFYFNRIFKEKT